MPIKKNDVVKIEITGLTAEGNGVGRVDGLAVFVPASAPNDVLMVKILKVLKTYAFGKIEEVLSPSNQRIKADCEQFLKCGGCVFRHISYEYELQAKEQRVSDAIERIGGIKDLKIMPIVGSTKPNNYRNKSQIPISKGLDGLITTGFFAPHSHRIVECINCELQAKEFDPAIKAFKMWANKYNVEPYNEVTQKGILRHLYLRIAKSTGEIMVCIVSNAKSLPHEGELVENLVESVVNIKSIVINTNNKKTNVIMGTKCRTLWGKGCITDVLCGLKFNISPLSFYQVNRDQAEKLYNITRTYANLSKDDTLLDLYCGTGTIGLSMASDAKKVIGVEVIENAINDAKNNAKINNISNAEFICADAANAAKLLSNNGVNPNVIILDPPRKGCSAELISIVISMSPCRIVYVSCSPATLARDLKIFNQYNYKPVELTPIDLFPRTHHVESVVLLERQP